MRRGGTDLCVRSSFRASSVDITQPERWCTSQSPAPTGRGLRSLDSLHSTRLGDRHSISRRHGLTVNATHGRVGAKDEVHLI